MLFVTFLHRSCPFRELVLYIERISAFISLVPTNMDFLHAPLINILLAIPCHVVSDVPATFPLTRKISRLALI
jgi:hypothetical protein